MSKDDRLCHIIKGAGESPVSEMSNGRMKMIISFRKWKERLRFLAWFITLTCVLYYVMSWISPWLEPSSKYKEPSGKSVKVFHEQVLANEGTFSERLRFFYWFGGE